MPQGRSKLPHAATKTQFSQIKSLEKRPLAFPVDHLCARCFPGHHLLLEDSVGLSPFCQKPGLSVCCYVLSRFSCLRLFVTLWSVACQASLSMEFSRQDYWSGLSFPPPGDLPNPRSEPTSPVPSALQADSLPAKP